MTANNQDIFEGTAQEETQEVRQGIVSKLYGEWIQSKVLLVWLIVFVIMIYSLED